MAVVIGEGGGGGGGVGVGSRSPMGPAGTMRERSLPSNFISNFISCLH